ncbi:hypothetical protein EMPG_10656 [Blastomyces silverae]|uniref:Uncharacterized protein n=1 Tax=Blastomyces silverae TaxID=2060906 RepID=A0A0H1B4D4_9EURO|nr:hypothetical protein EMPG_10656 [Blastomyces silverae]
MSYIMISDKKLRLNSFITRNEDDSKSISVKTSETEENIMLQLNQTLCLQHIIVC